MCEEREDIDGSDHGKSLEGAHVDLSFYGRCSSSMVEDLSEVENAVPMLQVRADGVSLWKTCSEAWKREGRPAHSGRDMAPA